VGHQREDVAGYLSGEVAHGAVELHRGGAPTKVAHALCELLEEILDVSGPV